MRGFSIVRCFDSLHDARHHAHRFRGEINYRSSKRDFMRCSDGFATEIMNFHARVKFIWTRIYVYSQWFRLLLINSNFSVVLSYFCDCKQTSGHLFQCYSLTYSYQNQHFRENLNRHDSITIIFQINDQEIRKTNTRQQSKKSRIAIPNKFPMRNFYIDALIKACTNPSSVLRSIDWTKPRAAINRNLIDQLDRQFKWPISIVFASRCSLAVLS